MMKTFRVWLEEKDQSNVHDTVLASLGLNDSGLETSLGTWDHDNNGDPWVLQQLQDLGFWKSLSPEKQAEARNMIIRGKGTVGELIQVLSSNADPTEKLGVSPPEGSELPKKTSPESQPSQSPTPQQLPAPM